jgi:transcription termination factor NusB
MELTPDERAILLAALFELTITHAEDDQVRDRATQLATKLGGDPEAMFYGGCDGRRHNRD